MVWSELQDCSHHWMVLAGGSTVSATAHVNRHATTSSVGCGSLNFLLSFVFSSTASSLIGYISIMSVREYQAQLLAPAIDSLMALDNALLELSEAVYRTFSSALQALASYFDVDNALLRHHLPSQGSLLAHAVPAFWVPLGVALALVTLFSLASFIHALATYTWSLLRPIDAYSQASYNQSMKYSDSSMIPLSPGRLSMATEHRDPTERIPTYGLHTDHSVLERVRARPDMQMLERWRVRPEWSIWPARVLRLLERKDYAELEGEIVRELEKGAIKRTCGSTL